MTTPLANTAIWLAAGAMALAAGVAVAGSRPQAACEERGDSFTPGFFALEQVPAPACIRIRLP